MAIKKKIQHNHILVILHVNQAWFVLCCFQFETLNTEAGHDYVTIFAGGLTIESSTWVASLSGFVERTSVSQYTSTNNVIILHFTSDGTINYGDPTQLDFGFRVHWANGLYMEI